MRRALAIAVRDQLRDATGSPTYGMGLSNKECGLAPLGGRPPAACGERYAGIRVGARSVTDTNNGIAEEYSVIITVTFRIGRVPFDRLGDNEMTALSTGFDDFVDLVRLTLHGDVFDGRVINRANDIIDSDGGPFVTGLQFLGDDDPFEVDGEWFHAESAKICGLVQNMRFGNCRRAQRIYSTQGVS